MGEERIEDLEKFSRKINRGLRAKHQKRRKKKGWNSNGFNTTKLFIELQSAGTLKLAKKVSAIHIEFAYYCPKCGWQLGEPNRKVAEKNLQGKEEIIKIANSCEKCKSFLGISEIKFPVNT